MEEEVRPQVTTYCVKRGAESPRARATFGAKKTSDRDGRGVGMPCARKKGLREEIPLRAPNTPKKTKHRASADLQKKKLDLHIHALFQKEGQNGPAKRGDHNRRPKGLFREAFGQKKGFLKENVGGWLERKPAHRSEGNTPIRRSIIEKGEKKGLQKQR